MKLLTHICDLCVVTIVMIIECKQCHIYFRCVALKEYMTIDLDKYHCPRCEAMCGPSLSKTVLLLNINNLCILLSGIIYSY